MDYLALAFFILACGIIIIWHDGDGFLSFGPNCIWNMDHGHDGTSDGKTYHRHFSTTCAFFLFSSVISPDQTGNSPSHISHCNDFICDVIGWMTPLGPILTLLIPVLTALFLAWDNTDLIPARQLIPFKERFEFLKNNLLFHIGFGLWFLIPLANVLFLSFAPVGGALYRIDLQKNE
jgi:hypothetical protein